MSNKHVENYGVWAGQIQEHDIDALIRNARSDRGNPHLRFRFSDGTEPWKECDVNVKSIDKNNPQLVYWVDKNFQHPIVDALRQLDQGYYAVPGDQLENAALALDFQRAQPSVLKFVDGRILPHNVEGPNNDIVDQLEDVFTRAVNNPDTTTIYIFGARYDDPRRNKSGIHDVHMNQGSDPKFENGVGQDGALVFHFADSDNDHFEGVFLAFATQCVPTDDASGLALPNSQPLSSIARPSRQNRL